MIRADRASEKWANRVPNLAARKNTATHQNEPAAIRVLERKGKPLHFVPGHKRQNALVSKAFHNQLTFPGARE